MHSQAITHPVTTLRVYVAPVDDGYGLFWEDGVPIFDDNSPEPAFLIRIWKRRGWAKRFAEQHGFEIFEPDEYPHEFSKVIP